MLVVLEGLVLAAMVGISAWGASAIRSEARFPVRVGVPTGFQGSMGKGAALTLWPVLGAVVLVGSALAEAAAVGLGLMAFLALLQLSTVKRAARS